MTLADIRSIKLFQTRSIAEATSEKLEGGVKPWHT